MTIKPGQTYRHCDPREHIRIRVLSYTPGHAHAQVVDADTGKRQRSIQTLYLHDSPYTQAGKPRRTGYALEQPDPATPALGAPPGATPAAPATELRTAAQTLMDLADTAQEDLDTADYWKPYNKVTAWRDGFVNGFGDVCSDLVAVFTPATAHALAGWLRYEADLIERVPGAELRGRTEHALTVAREINGASERTSR